MGDAAFEAALSEHAGLIARIVAAFESDPQTREDLRQEAALALWRAFPSWRGDCSLRTFVARVTQNVCVSHVRRASREPRRSVLDPSLPSAEEKPDERVARTDIARRVQAAVRMLPAGLREVAALTLEGFSTEEVAQTLGLSNAAVLTRISRAKASLRSVLGMMS